MNLSYIEETAGGATIVPVQSRLLTDRRIFLTGEITSATADEFLEKMLFLTGDNALIDLFINSAGGQVNDTGLPLRFKYLLCGAGIRHGGCAFCRWTERKAFYSAP